MPFRPIVDDKITIDRKSYIFTEHPLVKGMPYGQTGRRATVYQLGDVRGKFYALKVFTKFFRSSTNAFNATRTEKYALLPGLESCTRNVLTAKNHPSLLRKYPELSHSILMPWIHGQTWQEIILSRQAITREQSFALSLNFSIILTEMERAGIAHCDLSGGNILVNGLGTSLVDVEDLYGKGLKPPKKLPAGSAGYAHSTAVQGLWSPDADRFAAAVLLAEMIGWHDPQIRKAAVGEQFFDADEIGKSCDRYRVLLKVLRLVSKDVGDLFSHAWHSKTIPACPSLKEWNDALLKLNSSTALDEVSPIVAPSEIVNGSMPPASRREVRSYPTRSGIGSHAPKRASASYKSVKKVSNKKKRHPKDQVNIAPDVWVAMMFLLMFVIVLMVIIGN